LIGCIVAELPLVDRAFRIVLSETFMTCEGNMVDVLEQNPEGSLGMTARASTEAMGWRERVQIGWALCRLSLVEYFIFDSTVVRGLTGVLGWVFLVVVGAIWRGRRWFLLLCSLHRAKWSGPTDRFAERVVCRLAKGRESSILENLQPRIADESRNYGLLGPAVIVLKSASASEKGLVLAHYNHNFPVLAAQYDLDRLSSRYHLALEPSWSGFCDPQLLLYAKYRFPVFVEAYEPRDAAFLVSIRSNLVPVSIGGNWWVDHRVFFPKAQCKDSDVVMVAGWGSYKRHSRFFHALSRLRRNGHRLRVILIGYSVGWPKESVLDQARYFGVADQLEVHENVPYEQVNDVVNRAKVSVLWSRKEGFPRAVIESMFAGVPCIMRQGFNYGYHYPYINEETGCFADDAGLPRALLDLISRSAEMSPRTWVMENMTCQLATRILSESIGEWCSRQKEPWSKPLAVKITKLNNMAYWDPDDGMRFGADYEWIEEHCRRHTSSC
jgi:glycosyltransferase involved in cell wall biosynthesis